MTEFRAVIRLGNDAFHPDPALEVERLLREAADRVQRHGLPGLFTSKLRDVNGNPCGWVEVTP